ncbi:Glyceraldehyde 3-phosphate phosphatase [uncultured archaeon]|nr:Glyceraldehyde 3-phosphate phosphatase [uncultured archaeon]
MIKAVIFDLWDTLIPATINFEHVKRLAKHDHLTKTEFVIRYEKAVQLKRYNSFEEMQNDFFTEFNQHGNKELAQVMNDIYTKRMESIHYFPDVLPALALLRKGGLKLGLLSNTESFGFGRLESRLKFSNHLDVLAPSFVTKALKPDKKGFLWILKKLKVKPEEAIMIGDSLRADILGAQNAGLHNCLINRSGAKIDKSIAVPEFAIKSFDELEKVVGELNGK